MRLAVPLAAVLLWGISALLFVGPAFALIWFGGVGLWVWLVFPMPFAALIVAEAVRRLRAPRR
jgi:hypothetical protein